MERQQSKLGARVYSTLRDRIRGGELQPYQRLIETDISRELEVSRTPVREALQLLKRDGLVTLDRTGWSVRAQTADEIRSIYESIAILEGGAARLAAARATEEDLSKVRNAIYVESENRTDRVRLAETNSEFHASIVQASHNTFLIDIIEQSRAFSFDRHLAALYSDSELAESREQHRQIVAALESRDGDRVERYVREHMDLTIRTILPKLFPHLAHTDLKRSGLDDVLPRSPIQSA